MMLRHFRISSVIRWLLVVAGCVVLETAQPAFGADSESPLPVEEARSSETVIYPGENSRKLGDPETLSPRGGGPGWLTGVIALGMAGTGAWLLWRKRAASLPKGVSRKIQIEETRPIGNRQYLVLATCEGKRLLLGVTANQIDLLTELEAEKGET